MPDYEARLERIPNQDRWTLHILKSVPYAPTKTEILKADGTWHKQFAGQPFEVTTLVMDGPTWREARSAITEEFISIAKPKIKCRCLWRSIKSWKIWKVRIRISW